MDSGYKYRVRERVEGICATFCKLGLNQLLLTAAHTVYDSATTGFRTLLFMSPAVDGQLLLGIIKVLSYVCLTAEPQT